MLRAWASIPLRRWSSTGSKTGPKQMGDISKVWLTPLPANSKWIKPCRFHYIEGGVKKYRDILKLYDGLMVILYNTTRKKLVLVRQFRAAVYHGLITGNTLDIPEGNVDLETFPTDMGITLELCAGLVDKNKSLLDIAREEVLEECGYDVPTDSLELVFKYRSGIGTSSAALTLYYCEVCDDQRVSAGGGVNDELLEVVELSLDEARCLVQQGAVSNGAPGLLLAMLWFFANKVQPAD